VAPLLRNSHLVQYIQASDEFVAIIPGMSKTDQVAANVEAWKRKIPNDFWKELKEEGLIYEKAQTS